MTRRDWETPGMQVVGLFLNGDDLGSRTPEGEPVVGDSFLVLVNASPEQVELVLPPRRFGARWQLVLRTDDPDAVEGSHPARGQLGLESRSLAVLRRVA